MKFIDADASERRKLQRRKKIQNLKFISISRCETNKFSLHVWILSHFSAFFLSPLFMFIVRHAHPQAPVFALAPSLQRDLRPSRQQILRCGNGWSSYLLIFFPSNTKQIGIIYPPVNFWRERAHKAKEMNGQVREAKWLIQILIKSMCGANDGTANWQGARSYCIGMVEPKKNENISKEKKNEVMKKMKPS